MGKNGKEKPGGKPVKKIKKQGHCIVCRQDLPVPGHRGWCPLRGNK